MPEGALLTMHSAAERLGMAAPATPYVHVMVPPGSPKPDVPGVFVHEAKLPVPEPVHVRGIPCVPPVRCAVDLARGVARRDALATLDSALRTGGVTTADLFREIAGHGGLRGVRQARDLAAMADGGAECPQESHLRLLLIDGGLPVPQTQLRVYADDGLLRYRLDLGYRRRRLGIEYDGRSHLTPEALASDRDRHNWLAADGWRLRHFTARDVYQRPTHVVATVHRALH